jgi:3-hydroxyisobutyrate dehydrogenase-like beta-hydroxyacid dehydrogenase
MSERRLDEYKLGWIGTGRMGFPLARRLVEAGCDLAVYNRTKSKAEPLTDLGARVVDTPADLAERDIVFTMVAGNDDFREVALGAAGVLTGDGARPSILIDSSTVSEDVSNEIRAHGREVGTALLAAPVSGNPKVVKSGRLTFVVSGPEEAYETARPYFEVLGAGVTYVGDGEAARLVKICHNLMLGVVTQSLAEITVLAEKGGVRRSAFLDFLNKSVMGSTFTRYKTPAFVNLDFSPTFTPALLRKDFDLGLAAAHDLEVPMPVAALVREIVQSLIGRGDGDVDFAKLLSQQATSSNLELKPEDVEVSDGLEGRSGE